MGSAASSSQQGTTSQSTTTNPWSAQSPYLQQAFADASNAMGQSNSAALPTELTAGLTPQQISTFQQMIGYGGSSSIPGQEAASGSAASSSGLSGAQGALSGLGGFNAGSTNNMGNTIAGANQYAAGQDIPSQVQAAMRDANQEANDVTLPGMEQSAAGSGNINSSRTGVSEGIVQRGLAQQAGDLSAQLQAGAYNTGAGLASNQNTANNSANLSALMGAGSLGGSLYGAGNGALSSSINDQGNLFNMAGAGGAGLQGGNQSNDTNAQQLYSLLSQAPFQGLDQFYNIIGSNNWGGTSNSTGTSSSTSTPSMLQQIGTMLGAGAMGSKLLFS